MTNRKYALDDIQGAHFCPAPSFAQRQARQRGRKAEGLRYEAKAQEHLSALSQFYLPSPWILYIVEGRPQWCQPDGLDLDFLRGIITIVEIKLSHTIEAQRQLRGVYEPVVRCMFPRPQWGIRLVEVTRWYDPDIRFPEPVIMCPDPFKHQGPALACHIWRP